jgi:hypothetical protein
LILLVKTLNLLEDSRIPGSLVAQFFAQIFYFINSITLNALLTTKQHCTCSNGFQIKMEISDLEGTIWHSKTFSKFSIRMDTEVWHVPAENKVSCPVEIRLSLSFEYIIFSFCLPFCRDELAHITQAATLLGMDKKTLGDTEVLQGVCPDLNTFQVKRLLENFTPDLYVILLP